MNIKNQEICPIQLNHDYFGILNQIIINETNINLTEQIWKIIKSYDPIYFNRPKFNTSRFNFHETLFCYKCKKKYDIWYDSFYNEINNTQNLQNYKFKKYKIQIPFVINNLDQINTRCPYHNKTLIKILSF